MQIVILFYKNSHNYLHLTQLSVFHQYYPLFSLHTKPCLTSAIKTSHCQCYWNLSHDHDMLYNICDVSFLAFTSSSLTMFFTFNFGSGYGYACGS